METFIKLRPTARISYAGFNAGEDVESAKVHYQNFAYDIKVNSATTKDGKGPVIEANQSFEVDLGWISDKRKYSVMVVIHPALQQAAQGFSSAVVEPGEEMPLDLTFKALRKIDLTKLPYFARLYVIG